jgi:hypothetical protein
MLDQQPPDEAMPAAPLNMDRWKAFVTEKGELRLRVTLPSGPAAEAAFPLLVPSQFKPPAEASSCGADVTQWPRFALEAPESKSPE